MLRKKNGMSQEDLANEIGVSRQSVSKSVNELMGHKLEKGDDHGLYLGREKVCGLLTEILSDYEDGTISDYIIGIGIRYEMLRQEENSDATGRRRHHRRLSAS